MASKSDEEVLRTRDDFEMLRRPHLWPGDQDAICLKNLRLAQENGWPSFAVLILRKGDYHFLLRRGVGFDEEKTRIGRDKLLRELVGEGWIVD